MLHMHIFVHKFWNRKRTSAQETLADDEIYMSQTLVATGNLFSPINLEIKNERLTNNATDTNKII